MVVPKGRTLLAGLFYIQADGFHRSDGYISENQGTTREGKVLRRKLKYFFPDFRELRFGDDYRELTLLNRQELIDY